MKSTHFVEEIGPGQRPQVVGIRQQDFAARAQHLLGGQAFHCPFGPDRHEDGGGDGAMGEGHRAGAAVLVLPDQRELQRVGELGPELFGGLVEGLNGFHHLS